MRKENKLSGCLSGTNIYLCPLSKKHVNDKYLSWLNDKEVTRYLECRFSRTTKKDLKHYYQKIKKSRINKMFAIITKKGNNYIGNIKLGNINFRHKYADLGIMIGEKKYWGKGYGKEACGLLLGHAFNQLNLHKVILGIYANHRQAIKAYQKVGFKIEGRVKKLLNFEDRYVDKIIMGISRSEFINGE